MSQDLPALDIRIERMQLLSSGSVIGRVGGGKSEESGPGCRRQEGLSASARMNSR